MSTSAPSTPPADARTLRRAFLHGTAWVFAGRWAVRALGLVSTAALARLLAPADFGLIAIAMLVIGFIEVFLLLGVESALVRHPAPTREHWDTAWTIRLLQNLGTAALLAAAAPLAAIYFKEARIEPVIWALAGGIAVSGFSNIGVLEFNRDLRFDREFALRVVGKVLQLAVTLGTALWLRNYWALAIGTVSGYLIGCVLSYVFHPYRPRLSLARARELLGFSLRMVGLSIAYFAESRIDEILLGRLATNRALGLYSLASEMGQLPVSEVAAPLNRSMMPALARIQQDPGRMNAAYLNVIGTLAMVVIPAGVGMALVADPFVRVVLGYQWLEAVPLLQCLAVYGVFRGLYMCPMHALIAYGRPGVSAQFAWAGVLLLAPLGYALVTLYGAIGMAWARTLVGGIVFVIAAASMARVTGCRFGTQLARFARPAAAAALMAGTLLALPHIEWAHPALELFGKAALGALVYTLATLALWHAAGRPDGGERLALDTLRRRLQRVRPATPAGGPAA
jgi:O-antigen/teichoic acid export membrane protein